ncbi:MAG: sensor histidine kinase [Bacteroidota bacterium]
MTRLQRHLLFWIGYVLFKTYLNMSDNPDLPLGTYVMIIEGQLVFLLVKVPVVYFCFYVIDRYLHMKWKLWTSIAALVGAIIIGSVGISFCNHSIIMPFISHAVSTTSVFAFSSLLYHSFTLTFVAGVAVSIRLFRRQHQSTLREVVLQKEKTEAELKYLKGQLNPHFLFNTLNNIYSLAMKGSGETAEAVMRLSKMMRFILYEAGNATIALTDELQLIKDYIELEKLRYLNRLDIKYTKNIDDPTQQIAPLILMHFVENAFKHGVSESKSRSFVTIEITLKNKLLNVSVVNSKPGVVPNGTQIGMNNIKRQLNILYPNHVLRINDQQEYSIDLKIPF